MYFSQHEKPIFPSFHTLTKISLTKQFYAHPVSPLAKMIVEMPKEATASCECFVAVGTTSLTI